MSFELDEEFTTKHVATSLADATKVTEARIATGGPPGMVAGTAPNHLATKADWIEAIEAADDLVPPEGEWEGMNGDDSQFVNQLAKVEVDGWVAQGKAKSVVAKEATNKKFVGGEWSVDGSEFDANEEYVDGSASVTVNISHLTS